MHTAWKEIWERKGSAVPHSQQEVFRGQWIRHRRARLTKRITKS